LLLTPRLPCGRQTGRERLRRDSSTARRDRKSQRLDFRKKASRRSAQNDRVSRGAIAARWGELLGMDGGCRAEARRDTLPPVVITSAEARGICSCFERARTGRASNAKGKATERFAGEIRRRDSSTSRRDRNRKGAIFGRRHRDAPLRMTPTAGALVFVRLCRREQKRRMPSTSRVGATT
jgi:hypothetical protein